MKKINLLTILPYLIIAGMLLLSTGCGDSEEDIWSDVTSYSQIDGTWRAPSSVTIYQDDITQNVSYSNYTVTINSIAKTSTLNGSVTVRHSGENIAAGWDDAKEFYENLFIDQFSGGVNINFNDANYSYTVTFNNASMPLFPEEYLSEVFQINQHGTKLKLKTPENTLFYGGILTKQ